MDIIPLYVAIGAVPGALLRWKLGQCSSNINQKAIITIFINIIGSFTLGSVYSLTKNGVLNSKKSLMIGTGFCGSFTTFSTFRYHILLL